MWRDLGISGQAWKATPLAVRTALLGLQQQVRLLGIRLVESLSALLKQCIEAAVDARGLGGLPCNLNSARAEGQAA